LCRRAGLRRRRLRGRHHRAGRFLLLAFSEAPHRPPERKPQAAHLEDEQGHIVARLRIAGPGKIERVAN